MVHLSIDYRETSVMLRSCSDENKSMSCATIQILNPKELSLQPPSFILSEHWSEPILKSHVISTRTVVRALAWKVLSIIKH